MRAELPNVDQCIMDTDSLGIPDGCTPTGLAGATVDWNSPNSSFCPARYDDGIIIIRAEVSWRGEIRQVHSVYQTTRGEWIAHYFGPVQVSDHNQVTQYGYTTQGIRNVIQFPLHIPRWEVIKGELRFEPQYQKAGRYVDRGGTMSNIMPWPATISILVDDPFTTVTRVKRAGRREADGEGIVVIPGQIDGKEWGGS